MLTKEELQPRLRHLLEERFHLRYHRAERGMKGDALVLASGGSKSKANENEENSGTAYIMSGRFTASAATLMTFASRLAAVVHKPVRNKKRCVHVQSLFAPQDDAESTLPSIFTALQESFGLMLQPDQVAVEVVVVDSIDRVATEN